MATGKLEMVITADTGKAAQQVAALIKKMEEMGEKLEQNGAKGKSAFSQLTEFAGDFAVKLTGPTLAIRALMETLDLLEKKLAAVRREQNDSAAVAKTYGEALQKVAMAGGAKNLGALDKELRDTAGQYGLGEGGLVKLTDAASKIQAKGGDLTEAQRSSLRTETAKMLQLNQGMDATGYAAGMTNIVGASGGKLNATQANALMRSIQQRGGIGDLSAVAGAHDKLARTGQIGEMSMNDVGALAATVTKTSGEDMLERLPDVVAKIQNHGGDIEEALNTKEMYGHKVPSGLNVKMQGDFFQRLETLRGLNLKTEQLDKIFPMMSRGPGARNAMYNLLAPEGQQVLAGNRAFFGGAGVMGTDTAAVDFNEMMDQLPGEKIFAMARKSVSKGEARRAGDISAVQESTAQDALRRKMKAGGATAEAMGMAESDFTRLRQSGLSTEDAAAAAESSGTAGETPIIGGGMRRLVRGMSANMPQGAIAQNAFNGPVAGGNDELMQRLVRAAEITAGKSTTPRTPLGADTAAGR